MSQALLQYLLRFLYEESRTRVLDKSPRMNGTWPQTCYKYSTFPQRFNNLELQKDKTGQISSSSILSKRRCMISYMFRAEYSVLSI